MKYDTITAMLEAFFTRQRKRNIFVLLTAFTGLVWGGTQTLSVVQPPQASQTAVESAADSAPATTPTNQRPISQVQPVETAPTTETATDVQPAPAATTTQPAPVSAQISATSGKSERVETTDAVSYVLHYTLAVPADDTIGSVTTKLTTDVACIEPPTKTFTYTNQSNLVVTCTVLKTGLSSVPDQLSFKLDVSGESASYGSLTYALAK